MRYKETKFGKIPWDWAVLPVKAVAEVVTDYVANVSFASLAKNVKYKETEDVAILIRLVDYNNGFKNNFVYIDEHAYEFLAKSKLFGDEIIISNVGINVGTVFRCPHLKYKMSLGPNAIMVRFAGNNDFYYYWLKGFQGQQMLRSIVTGSVQPKFNKTNFRDMLVPVPPIVIQNRIVTILNCLDRKIELNNKINENLEQQATALFNNFYDQAETEISFTDVIQILGGGTPKTGESGYWGGKIPFFTPKDVGSPYTLNTEKIITEAGLARCNSRLYPINTVFVTARGTVGKVGMAGVPMAMNQSCYALVGKGIHQLLVYFYTLKVIDRLRHKASGAVFDAVTTKDFESEHIMRLPDSIEKVFLCAAEPMYQAILSNSIENQQLAGLRDALLPKLISGEIDVSGI